MSTLQNYLIGTQPDAPLTDTQLAGAFPLYTKIHRRVECIEESDEIEEHKKYIGFAKADEYQLKKFPNKHMTISMEDEGIGMSFSSHCQYANHVKAAAVPFSEIKTCGASVISSGSSVWINGCCFPKILCYSCVTPQNVNSAQEQGERDDWEAESFTVENALNCAGKDDRCMLNSNFSYYFDNNDHGVLCLRKPLDSRPELPTFDLLPHGAGVLFHENIFDTSSWTFCGEENISVKFPRGFMIDIQRGDNLETEINKIKNADQKKAAQLLWQVFMVTPIDGAKSKGVRAGDVLCDLYHARDTEAVSKQIWSEIIDIIDENAECLFGLDTYSKWDTSLRLKLQINTRDAEQAAAIISPPVTMNSSGSSVGANENVSPPAPIIVQSHPCSSIESKRLCQQPTGVSRDIVCSSETTQINTTMNRDLLPLSRLISILAVQPMRCMKLSTLGLKVNSNWSLQFKDSHGRLKDFLRKHCETFSIQDNLGVGNDTVTYISDESSAQAVSPRRHPFVFPDPKHDLWRTFDLHDAFFDDTQRMNNISKSRELYWESFKPTNKHSCLCGKSFAEARIIYDKAYNKCTRLSVNISGVANANGPSHLELTAAFKGCFDEREKQKLFLFKSDKKGLLYSDVYATAWGAGRNGNEPLDALKKFVDALSLDRTLTVKCVGLRPVLNAVKQGIRELLELHTFNNLDRALATLTITPTSTIIRAPTEHIFRREVYYDRLSESVMCDKSKRVKRIRKILADKEAKLREKCAKQRNLSIDKRRDYINQNGIEWISIKEFCLGSGSEATVYMGLLREGVVDEKAESPHEPKCQLVAVKVIEGLNPYKTQEMEHFVKLVKIPGVVHYHKGFEISHWKLSNKILVQDIGLCSLRRFLTGAGEFNKQVDVLSSEAKIKLSKALCMAVRELHEQKPSIVHRDIRPENILLMPDMTIALTDFGLVRRAPVKGSSKRTNMTLTTMQPYEVQLRFLNDVEEMHDIPIDSSADIFMLGLVIAYVHLGHDPFDSDLKIMQKLPPDLGQDLQKTQPWLYHLLVCMLDHDKANRPNINDVLKHPYFRSWCHNFDTTLVSRIERIIVSDGHPVDNTTFAVIEKILEPIEREMATAGKKWYTTLPAALFEGLARLPYAGSVRQLAFQNCEDIPPRVFPLPNVAQLVKWLSNVITHLASDANLQARMRRSRASVHGEDATACFEYASDFFTLHPAVEWFLPKIWEHTMRRRQMCVFERTVLKAKYEAAISKLELEEEEFVFLLE